MKQVEMLRSLNNGGRFEEVKTGLSSGEEKRKEMLSSYEGKTAAEGYIFGFEFNGDLYTYFTDSLQNVNDALKLDKAAESKGGMWKIRVRFNTLLKTKLVRSGKAVKAGKVSAMEYADKYNKGEHFERFVHELNGRTWVKDNVPFNVAGDIEIAGKQIQIKFDGAELTNERTLARA